MWPGKRRVAREHRSPATRDTRRNRTYCTITEPFI